MEGSVEKVLARLRRKLIRGPPNNQSENMRPDNCSVASEKCPDTSRDSFTIDELVRILTEQDKEVRAMREKLEIVCEKNVKLEQLVAIKDKKLELLMKKGGGVVSL